MYHHDHLPSPGASQPAPLRHQSSDFKRGNIPQLGSLTNAIQSRAASSAARKITRFENAFIDELFKKLFLGIYCNHFENRVTLTPLSFLARLPRAFAEHTFFSRPPHRRFGADRIAQRSRPNYLFGALHVAYVPFLRCNKRGISLSQT
jgi:hypothetical protein